MMLNIYLDRDDGSFEELAEVSALVVPRVGDRIEIAHMYTDDMWTPGYRVTSVTHVFDFESAKDLTIDVHVVADGEDRDGERVK